MGHGGERPRSKGAPKAKTGATPAVPQKNGWVLYTGLYEIKWKNGVADEIAINGVILKIKLWKSKKAQRLFA